MANCMFDYIKELYTNELYHDVVQTVRFYDSNVTRIKEVFGLTDGINILFFYATSLYHTKEYRLALQIFQHALAYYSDHFGTFHKDSKSHFKRKNSGDDISDNIPLNGSPISASYCSPVEVKYRMHLCYRKLGQFTCAINTLQSVPQDLMTLKILIPLAELYVETNNPREALNCYMSVVMSNPLALHSMRKILNNATETVAKEFVEMICHKINEEFPPLDAGSLTNLIQAFNLARFPKYFRNAYQLFFDLRTSKVCKRPQTDGNVNDNMTIYLPEINNSSDNIYMLLEAAKFLYFDGFVTNAARIYKTVYCRNPDLLEGLDCYAACLYRDVKYKELQKLSSQVMALCSAKECTRKVTIKSNDKPSLLDFDSNTWMITRPEPWIVIGYYSLSKRDHKSLFFATKALQIDPSCEEAMVLKTLIYSKKVGETHNLLKGNREFIDEIEQFNFKSKYRKLYVRFEILKYLAEAILVKDGRDIAENYVKESVGKYGMSPRICTFYSNLILMDRNSVLADRKTAIRLLESAVKVNPYYMSAVINLSRILIEDGEVERALKMLIKATEKFSYQFIHKMIVECYTKLGQEDKAVMHQTMSCIKTPIDSSTIAMLKIKEEHLSDSLTEMDMTSIEAINPTGDGMEALDLANYPSDIDEMAEDAGDDEGNITDDAPGSIGLD